MFGLTPSQLVSIIALVLIVTGWAWNARVLRSQVLALREKDFVSAAIVSGEGRLRIIFREVLPNMTSLLMSGFISATVYAIGAQVGLEFLGLGNVGVVTWGTVSGSMLPFALRRLGFDPASASAPFVATLVDVSGLVIYFTVASLILRGTLL